MNHEGEIVSGLDLIPGTETRHYHSKKQVRPGTGGNAYVDSSQSIYALPADGQEFDRLEKQHQLMLHLFGGPVLAPIGKQLLSGGGKVIDVGCGPGSWIHVNCVPFSILGPKAHIIRPLRSPIRRRPASLPISPKLLRVWTGLTSQSETS
jgi:hypothetical protein